MANPNMVTISTINGNNSLTSLTTTNATSLVSNAASSGKIFKINSINVANTDTSNAVSITIDVYSAASLGGSAYAIVSAVAIPANASLTVTDKSTSFYLKEDQSVGATAGTASKLIVVASWEEIS